MEVIMVNISILEYGSNKELTKTNKCNAVPNIGDYFILADRITEDWKTQLHIVRAVTHTLSGNVILHVEHVDIDKQLRKEEELKEKMKQILRRENRESGIQTKSSTEVD